MQVPKIFFEDESKLKDIFWQYRF